MLQPCSVHVPTARCKERTPALAKRAYTEASQQLRGKAPALRILCWRTINCRCFMSVAHPARAHLSSHGSRMPLNSNVCVSGATTVHLRTCMPEPAEDLHLHILRCSCLPLAASCRNVYVCLLRGAQVRSATRLHHGRTCMAVDVKGDEHGWCARPARAAFRQRTRRACLGCTSAEEHMLCVQS